MATELGCSSNQDSERLKGGNRSNGTERHITKLGQSVEFEVSENNRPVFADSDDKQQSHVQLDDKAASR